LAENRIVYSLDSVPGRHNVEVDMLSLITVVVLLAACVVGVVHCASLSSLNLGRDAWLEDFEKIARQVCTEWIVTVDLLHYV